MLGKKSASNTRGSIAPTVIWWIVVAFLALTVVYPSIRLIINSFKGLMTVMEYPTMSLYFQMQVF